MTATASAADLSRFCSTCALAAGLDTAGSAYAYDHVVAAEIPLPWPMSMYSEPGVLPRELLDFRTILVESYRNGTPLSAATLALAPDPAYTPSGWRRVLSYRRPEGMFARFVQREYLVPAVDVGPLCWALLVDHARIDTYADYLQPASNRRDFMVCTHGAVDAACAKFGYPLYRHLRGLAEASDGRLRAWRASHFGGHVFAPTLVEMPEFRYWGYVNRPEVQRLAHRTGEAAALEHCFRGWGGFDDPFLQTAERALFVRHGWQWLDYDKQGAVLERGECDAVPWADVRIDFRDASADRHGSCILRVEVSGHIETFHTTGDPTTYPYPQYIVTRLQVAD